MVKTVSLANKIRNKLQNLVNNFPKIVWKVKILLNLPIPKIVNLVSTNNLTYLSKNALNDLFECVTEIEKKGLNGILIEAGCALGGSAIVIATAKSKWRPLFVYDVFDLIPPPTQKDGTDVQKRYEVIKSGQSQGLGNDIYYGYQKNLLDKVIDNFRTYNLPVEENNIHLVKGLFEDVLLVEQPVALAHIDGDWYSSVMTCLQQIEPHLIAGGVLIIDDYDHWSGCRQAVDEYFADKQDKYMFVRKSRLHIVRN
ncbi:TylF/MycF/NovP-related O-methyltransferase [Anabaena azotica]|uniref:Class I SAM-dependent methyltransferase n=1 Tax=Anabaena azotica FACHB-119 TaxID=947527 RepID=A0ABR8DCC2_9NOST|nr:TylF/MycF/NovP-related O-methyltransferase [Anabaena azotica]MBD2504616.1 class I SAM-dependent methyltransferase [Anabaena azotica FACHB-119]